MRFRRWVKDTWFWYSESIVLFTVVGLFVVVAVVMAVLSTVQYNEKLERCNDLGGVYVKEQCVKAERIKL